MNRHSSYILAMGGHVKHLVNLAQFKITNPHSWSKFRQLKAVGKRTNADWMIETGTYLGNTTRLHRRLTRSQKNGKHNCE